MSSRRPLVLMSVLLLLMSGYFYKTRWQYHYTAEPPTLPGKNALFGLTVTHGKDGWVADFDYFYVGEPQPVGIEILLLPDLNTTVDATTRRSPVTFISTAQRGTHHVRIGILHPGQEGSSRQVIARLKRYLNGNEILASQIVDQAIDWPKYQTWILNQTISAKTPEENLGQAIALIDTEQADKLAAAKLVLEKLVAADPKFDAAYVELARIAMKSNWGTAGLHQAETLLNAALAIRPDSANAKILLGYVATHQHHFAKAETLFSEAVKSNPPNLWLWVNWGELFEVQGKPDQAAIKYRDTLARPITHDSYDWARKHAYVRLLEILKNRNDLDGMEYLYKQRLAEFGPGSCFSTDYARFTLQVRGNTQGAIDLAQHALNQDCDDSPARQVLGMALYTKWASVSGPERLQSLNLARIYLPAGPLPLYLLATGEQTLAADKLLIASGEAIDQRDNENLTALAYALQKQDLSAAKRLLVLGARWDQKIGAEDIPVALVPVLTGDIEGVRLMQKFGAKYSNLRFLGKTALEIAAQSGNRALLKALGADSGVTL